MKIWFGELILGLCSIVGATTQLDTKKKPPQKVTDVIQLLRFEIELMVVG